MKETFYALLLSVMVLVGAATLSDAHAQSNTEKLDAVVENTAEANSILADIRAALEGLAAALLSLSDDVDAFDSRISNLESKLDELAAGYGVGGAGGEGTGTSLSIPESIQEINAQLVDLRAELARFPESVRSGPMQGMGGSGGTADPPAIAYARSEVVFDAAAGDRGRGPQPRPGQGQRPGRDSHTPHHRLAARGGLARV